MRAPELTKDFATTRLGVIMSPKDGEPHEAWGVLNPAGIRSPDGTMHLFPRLIAEGNYSRIGHAREMTSDPAGCRRSDSCTGRPRAFISHTGIPA